jgi:thiosulfate dehydrogenase (quinone) large subunit
MRSSQAPQSEHPEMNSLRGVALLGDLPDEDLDALAAEAKVRHFEAGAELMHQGDPSDALFVLKSGRADVLVTRRDGTEQVIDHIGPGQPAGEFGLLTGAPRSATIRAVDSVTALVLPREVFAAAMERAGFARNIATELAGRLAAGTSARALDDPPISRFLFGDTRLALLWLALRVWLGYQWIQSGLGKVMDPAWMGTGLALRGFWQGAVSTSPRPVITYDWYRAFIEALLAGGHYVWFAKLISVGEVSLGVALVLGAFTGLAAAGGLLMNANYLLAGSSSTNPVLAVLEVFVILGWKVAGWWGLDRWLLPLLGPLLRPVGFRWRLPVLRRSGQGSLPTARA